MIESALALAFLMGVVSAISLPIGAVTSAFWVPSDRVISFLMAFGGGALLAALTLDLVGPALGKGHFFPLAIGWVIGGLVFIGLNEMVNNYGGFMRKASTTIHHLRKQDHRRFKRILSGVNRIDIFRPLSLREFRALAASIRERELKGGEHVFRKGDPAESLFVLAEGSVQLIDPADPGWAGEVIGPNAAFGRFALFAGTPHAASAIAREDTTVWVLPRRAFAALLPNSPELMQATHRWLRSPQMLDYLCMRHGFDPQAARRWSDDAVRELSRRGQIPPAAPMERRSEHFMQIAETIHRFPLFAELPEHELSAVASYLIHKRHLAGYAYFHQREFADRLYIVDEGEVTLLDPAQPTRAPVTLRTGDAFGALAMVAGARHTVSAVAASDTAVWVLRKSDLEQLLRTAPEFAQRFRTYLERGEIANYLRRRHHFDVDKAERWVRLALKSVDAGRPLPAASKMSIDVTEHKGAPIAIWLGILLDGIPEALVIGASLVSSHVSLSLLAGLFISNFPEALSSSVGMKQQGFAFRRILLMWTSLVLITGVLAAAGNFYFQGAPPGLFALIEGVAAGAMLTMIAQTLLPEAYFKGGSLVGISTLLGFLVAISFKALE